MFRETKGRQEGLMRCKESCSCRSIIFRRDRYRCEENRREAQGEEKVPMCSILRNMLLATITTGDQLEPREENDTSVPDTQLSV